MSLHARRPAFLPPHSDACPVCHPRTSPGFVILGAVLVAGLLLWCAAA